MERNYSIVIPAYNEEGAIGAVLEDIGRVCKGGSYEIIVVDDCSTDRTAQMAGKYPVRVLTNVQNFGYGYSLKRGIMEAKHGNIIILDADGSYPVSSIPMLVEEYEKGFDMVVGARKGAFYRGSFVKRCGRICFRFLSEFATGRRIPDINSGFRVFRKESAIRFFHTLSSGFSFTTTVTLAFMLNAYSVRYIPVEYHKRAGSSKVRYVRDTLRSTQIIIEAIVFYNPVKIFILCALAIVAAGVLAICISIFAPVPALLFLLAVTSAIVSLEIGFVAVFLKFMNHEKERNI